MSFWKRGGKYGANKVERFGIRFDSMLERSVHDLLRIRERAGEISIEKIQDRIKLASTGIVSIPDFRVRDRITGERFHVEAKGFETDRWKIIKKLWPFFGPGKIEVWGGSHLRPRLQEVIHPDGFEKLGVCDECLKKIRGEESR